MQLISQPCVRQTCLSDTWPRAFIYPDGESWTSSPLWQQCVYQPYRKEFCTKWYAKIQQISTRISLSQVTGHFISCIFRDSLITAVTQGECVADLHAEFYLNSVEWGLEAGISSAFWHLCKYSGKIFISWGPAAFGGDWQSFQTAASQLLIEGKILELSMVPICFVLHSRSGNWHMATLTWQQKNVATISKGQDSKLLRN